MILVKVDVSDDRSARPERELELEARCLSFSVVWPRPLKSRKMLTRGRYVLVVCYSEGIAFKERSCFRKVS